MRPADAVPFAFPLDRAADGARRVFDKRHVAARGDRRQRRQIARHPELMHREDGFRLRRERRFDERGVDVERRRIDVNEDRRRSAVADGVRRGNERMADGDDLIAEADTERGERDVKRRRAARHRAGMRRADGLGEFAFERRDLGALRHPAGENRAARGLRFLLVHPGTRHGNHGVHGHGVAAFTSQLRTISLRSSSSGDNSCARYQSSSCRMPSASGTRTSYPISDRACDMSA